MYIVSLTDFPLNQAMFGPPRETFDDGHGDGTLINMIKLELFYV